jgi:hypothetical protein
MAWRIGGFHVATCAGKLVCPPSELPNVAPAERV